MDYKTPNEETNSFEERKAETLRASLPPWQERISEAVEMTLKEYGVTREELIARRGKLKITFIKETKLS